MITMTRDGDQWCALVGDDLQTGVAGFGDTQGDALRALAQAIDEEGIEI